MREEKTAWESISCIKADGDFRIDDHMQDKIFIGCLYSLCRDNLICVRNNACEYSNCKNDHILEEALMIKRNGINGEMSIAS